MKKPVLWATVSAFALWLSTPGAAQYSGQAGGMDPSGNATFGGGNVSNGNFDNYATALRLIHAQRYGDAIPYLELMLKDHPRSADTLEKLGYTHFMIGEYPAAQAFLEKALSIDSDNTRAHRDLGEVFLAMHDRPSADAQMTALNQLCADGCDEKDELAKAIADAGSSTAPATH